MNTEEFEQYVSQQKGQQFLWSADMLPKINDIVWRSLKAVQETQDQRNNTFEIYGFDIVLDECFNPWVIEINLSPACAERADWLSKMLDDSHLDLLNHIEGKILVSMGVDHWGPDLRDKLKSARNAAYETRYSSNLNLASFYDKSQVLNRWVRIPESIAEIKLYINSQLFMQQSSVDLQLIIQKANLQFEKRFERSFRMEEAAKLIQRVWLGTKSRLLVRQIRQNLASIIIQKFSRRFLAQRKIMRLRKARSSIVIQKWFRMFLAKAQLRKLRNKRLLLQQINLVICLQQLWRKKTACRKVMGLRKLKATQIIQKALRGYRSRKTALKLRDRAVKVLKIQLFFKRRYRQKVKAAIKLQCQLRRFSQRSKVLTVLPIFRGAQLGNRLAEIWKKKIAFNQLLRNKTATYLQTQLRRYLVVKEVRRLRVGKAQQMIQKLGVRLRLKLKKDFLRSLVKSYVQKVLIVQRVLRLYLQNARGKRRKLKQEQDLKDLQERYQKDKAATIIQCQLRRILALKTAEWAVIELGAVQMIQSCWRGYTIRKSIFEKQSSNQNEQPDTTKKISLPSDATKTESTMSKFINNIEYSRYVKKVKQQIKVEHINQGNKSRQTTLVKKPTEKVEKVQPTKQLPYQTSEAWSIFNKRKKELKKSYFDSGNPHLKGVNLPQRSLSQMSHSHIDKAESQKDQKQSAFITDPLHQTAILESEASFQELNETTLTINSQKSAPVSKIIQGLKATQFENLTLNQLKIQQQKQAMKIQKSFAQSLQEILEQQKIATVGQVSKLMNQVERTSISSPKPVSVTQKHQLEASKVAPYLQPPTKLSIKPKQSAVAQVTPTTELKSNFQQTFEYTQQQDVNDEVILARSSYNKAHKVFTQSAAEMFNQIRTAQNQRLQIIKNAHQAAQMQQSVYNPSQSKNKSVHSAARASGTQLFL